ncbi:hypothetical protein AWN76_010625 [Rhodothermaceae bacterium RA]|nr:hypothetical protein AWN76_010625 [Rhodothermaceae bacterium RA]
MRWFKHVLVDVAATGLIVFAALTGAGPARWIVLVYTPLMLVLKVLALFLGGLLHLARPQGEAPPPWFLHGLYAVNVVAPLLAQWWLIAAGWALIWLLSALAERKASLRTA